MVDLHDHLVDLKSVYRTQPSKILLELHICPSFIWFRHLDQKWSFQEVWVSDHICNWWMRLIKAEQRAKCYHFQVRIRHKWGIWRIKPYFRYWEAKPNEWCVRFSQLTRWEGCSCFLWMIDFRLRINFVVALRIVSHRLSSVIFVLNLFFFN